MAPRWLKIALCWLKLVLRRPTWPPKASQVPQDETKMASKMASTSICFSFLVFFSQFASGRTFSNEFFTFRELGMRQFLSIFGANFDGFWIIFGILGRVCPKRPQDSLNIAAKGPGPNMGQSWLQVGSSWAYLGPKLAPTWLQLGPCWAHLRAQPLLS